MDFRGSSGGALIDANGQLVALITSNTRHAGLGSFPGLNFSIACTQLRPIWQAITEHGHQPEILKSRLQALDVRTDSLEKVWQLGAFVAPGQRLQKSPHVVQPSLEGLQRLMEKVAQDRPGPTSRL
ncbi:hypothetical protein WJX73_002601 [Symbiochloris irregularis]|uniref:Serine protease n=1 Tax=Symbiochloris irregularis TaxID=706552 RepID=A0AAW1PV04_9CHLO